MEGKQRRLKPKAKEGFPFIWSYPPSLPPKNKKKKHWSASFYGASSFEAFLSSYSHTHGFPLSHHFLAFFLFQTQVNILSRSLPYISEYVTSNVVSLQDILATEEGFHSSFDSKACGSSNGIHVFL